MGDAEMIQVFVRGPEGTTRTINIRKDASIEDLFKAVVQKTGIPKNEMRLLFTSKTLHNTNAFGKQMYCSDFGIQNESNLILVLRLLSQKRFLDEVELTDEPDMITLDDDPDGLRALMPCGHAIGPESLTAYCRSLLTAGKYDFRCPKPGCFQLWEYLTVQKLAILTAAERTEFENKIAENYLFKAELVQECPKCHSMCDRQNKKSPRVVCPWCSRKRPGFEFCWYCLKKWQTSGTANCGNDSCSGEDPRLRVLQKCSKKEILGVLNCPSVRACPKCGLMIEHKEACKQMTCKCSQKFCFICLKMVNAQGTYQCGSYNTKCSVAPIQTEIPELK